MTFIEKEWNRALYRIISNADALSHTKGWVYLMYYPLLKEVCSMKRHLFTTSDTVSYTPDLVDAFYFNFNLYDTTLPIITLDQFKSVLDETDFFVPSPVKSYACGYSDYTDKRLLVNYHDASPCFSFCGQHFQLEPLSPQAAISEREKDRTLGFILESLMDNGIVDPSLQLTLWDILSGYGGLAVKMFMTVSKWLYPLLHFYRGEVVTDQTLAPGQCCVNHLLKSSGNRITVLQHQKNIILTDLYPIVYLDFCLADKYVSWVSREALLYNYSDYVDTIPVNVIQRGEIRFRHEDVSRIADRLENGKKCLLILTSRERKYISGTVLDSRDTGSTTDIVHVMCEFGYEVYVRRDPRDKSLAPNGDFLVDDSRSLQEAIAKYDFCICDRPGGATIEVMEQSGFVFVPARLEGFKRTPTYNDLNVKQAHIRELISIDKGGLFDMFDLLCA